MRLREIRFSLDDEEWADLYRGYGVGLGPPASSVRAWLTRAIGEGDGLRDPALQDLVNRADAMIVLDLLGQQIVVRF